MTLGIRDDVAHCIVRRPDRARVDALTSQFRSGKPWSGKITVRIAIQIVAY